MATFTGEIWFITSAPTSTALVGPGMAGDPNMPPTPSVEGTPSKPSGKTNVGAIVGSLFGGLALGALVAILAALFLRRHRQRRTAPQFDINGAMYARAEEWEKEKRTLTTQLNDVQADRAQLRTYLQVSDTRDPRDIVELFDKLQVAIKNSCLLASSAILKSVQLRASWTTKDATNLRRLQMDLGKAAGLALSDKGVGRRPEDFLPLALRYLVNSALVETLFSLFHPEVSREENKLLLDAYRDIRQSDSQQLAARWRCSTFMAIEGRNTQNSDWAGRFADDVNQRVSSIISSLFGEIPSGMLPPKFRTDLVSIGTEAYKWNHSAKSSFKALDFRPLLFNSENPFDPASMTFHLSHKPDELPPRKIIAAVTLALLSGAIVGSGNEKKEEYVWQTKAEVLTEGFFS